MEARVWKGAVCPLSGGRVRLWARENTALWVGDVSPPPWREDSRPAGNAVSRVVGSGAERVLRPGRGRHSQTLARRFWPAEGSESHMMGQGATESWLGSVSGVSMESRWPRTRVRARVGPSPWRGDSGPAGGAASQTGGGRGRGLRPAPGRQGALGSRRGGRPAGGALAAAEAAEAGGGGGSSGAALRPAHGARGSGGSGGSRSGGGGAAAAGGGSGGPGRAGAPLAERTGRGPRSPPCRRGSEARRARAEASGGRAGLWPRSGRARAP